MTTISPINLLEVWSAPPPLIDYVIPGLVRGTTGIIVASGGTGKSFAALELALSIAVGRDVFGLIGEDPAPDRAAILAIEDPPDIIQLRLRKAIESLTDAEREMAAGNVSVLPLFGTGFCLARKQGQDIVHPHDAEVRAFLEADRPAVVFVDTTSRAVPGLNENDNGEMALFVSYLETLCRSGNCAIVLIHHVSKQAASSASDEASASRGASALVDNPRWGWSMRVATREEVRDFGLIDDDTPDEHVEEIRRGYVRVAQVKGNYGPPRPARWMERRDGGVLFAARLERRPAERGPGNGGRRPRRMANEL